MVWNCKARKPKVNFRKYIWSSEMDQIFKIKPLSELDFQK